MLKNRKWKDTLVAQPQRKTKNPILYLTRMDNCKFPLVVGNNLFYVLYGDNGMELINVEEINFKILDAEKDSVGRLMRRKKPAEQWCVKYTRCLCTQKARDECASKKDHLHQNQNGVRRTVSLGSDSLDALLRTRRDDSRLIFHKGDLPFETAAMYIVGFVGWDSMSSEAESEQSQNELLKKINSNLSRQTNLKIQKLKHIDWVLSGPDFSEPCEKT